MLTLLLPYPAALVKTTKTRTLVIADPHIGWEMALQEKGIHVPSQTPKILNKLVALLQEQKPNALLVLGDVKYTVVKAELGEWHDIPDFFSELLRYVKDIGIIRGNHDANLEPLLPEKVKMLPATGIIVGDVGFFHGHKWPSPALLSCKALVMGHVHPVVVFHDPSGFRITRQVWVKAKCNTGELAKTLLQKHNVKIKGTAEATVKNHYGFSPSSAEVLMMPSFNDFLGGRAINETRPGKEGQAALIGPMLRSGTLDMDDAEVYLLDGTYLGTLNQLRNMS
jgi:putative SbcD/Mre11-related phosphoesterase